MAARPRAAAGVIVALAVACAGADDLGAEVRTSVLRHGVDAREPAVAPLGRGAELAAWTESTTVQSTSGSASRSRELRVKVTTYLSGRRRSRVRTVGRVAGSRAAGLQLAASQDGAAIFAWYGAHGGLRFAVRTRGGRISADRAVPGSGGASEAVLAAGPHGRFVVAWRSDHHGASPELRVATGAARGGIRQPVLLPASDPSRLAAAINSSGTVMVTDEEYERPTRVWLRAPAASFESAGTVPGSSHASGGVRTGLRPDGSVIALLSGTSGEKGMGYSVRSPHGAAFGDVIPLSQDGQFGTLAVDSRGAVVAAWDRADERGTPSGVSAVRARPGGRFGRVREIAGGGARDASVVAGAGGTSLIVWRQLGKDGSRPRLRSVFSTARRDFGTPRTVQRGSVSTHADVVTGYHRGVVLWTAAVRRGVRKLSLALVR